MSDRTPYTPQELIEIFQSGMQYGHNLTVEGQYPSDIEELKDASELYMINDFLDANEAEILAQLEQPKTDVTPSVNSLTTKEEGS